MKLEFCGGSLSQKTIQSSTPTFLGHGNNFCRKKCICAAHAATAILQLRRLERHTVSKTLHFFPKNYEAFFIVNERSNDSIWFNTNIKVIFWLGIENKTFGTTCYRGFLPNATFGTWKKFALAKIRISKKSH